MMARRTQAERRRQSEKALVDAAVHVIATQGVAAVTFEALGCTAGLSRGLVSVRFGSKARLIEAVLCHLRVHQEELAEKLDLAKRTGLDAILTYYGFNMGELGKRDDVLAYFRLLSSAVAETNELQAVFADNHAEVEQRLRGWAERGQADGTIRSDLAPQSVALIVGCQMFGMAMQSQLSPSSAFEEVLEESLEMLRASLTA